MRVRLISTEQEIGQLSSLLSHDLRARLRSIDCDRDELSDLLGDPETGEAKDSLDRISGAIDRIDDLVAMSLLLLRDARHSPRLSTHPVEMLARQALKSLRKAHPEHPIEPAPLSDVHVRIAPERALAALNAILKNAVVHGAPPVRITFDTTGEPGWCRLTVWDDGPGIPSEDHERAFEMGLRLTHAPGHGLGLYVARRLLEGWARGPFIEGASAEGQPTGVSFDLPLSGP
ncbi:MAG: sensor histidine kinase [Bradymonadia bacterium]